MNLQVKQTQIKLEEIFKEIALLGNISESEGQELFTKLEGAIVLNIIGKLLDELPEDHKNQIEEKQLRTSEDLFKFLSSIVPKKKLHTTATISTEEVVKKFFEKI